MKQGRLGDLESLLALDNLCFERPWTQAAWNTELCRDWVRVWILPGGEHHRIAGFAVCWQLGEQAELLRIAVAPDQRGKGHAKALLRQGLSAAKEGACSSMSLDVEETNVAAIALYKSLGFEQVGRRPGYYAGKDGLVFSKSL